MSLPIRVVSFLLASCSSVIALPVVPETGQPPQYVLISFDGAHDLEQWQRSRNLAARTGASFTYFLSCVFLLQRADRAAYSPPQHRRGSSNVGFAQTQDEVAGRLAQMRLALAEGNEIGSHGCGHFDGKSWSKAEWLSEFRSFREILRTAYRRNGLAEPAEWQTTAREMIRGFRAPYLATGKELFEALEEDGYRYDASGISRGPVEPEPGGPARFALPRIPEGPSARPVIAMDYNLYVRHSGGFERPAEAADFEERAFRSFMDAFDAEFAGDRIPLQLGFHFTLMNDGAYWRALERFAESVCVRAEVRCVTYSAYLAETSGDDAPAAAGG